MICADHAASLTIRYADGELDAPAARSIQQHIRECRACAATYERVLGLRARLRAQVDFYPAPASLRARVQALQVSANAAPARSHRSWLSSRWAWLTQGAIAGCAATLLAFAIGTATLDLRADADIAREAVAAHVHATLGERLIEVASSDQHTVKPWLSARLDYSPPVRDFTDEGFILMGGRLDTLEHHRVATLVYRHRLHTIDVFVRPAGAHAPSAPTTLRGFNVAHATGAGMDWLAVSDVSPDTLAMLVERLAAQ